MIQSIAFLTYAVSDIKKARHFYEDIVGLKLTHEAGGEWFEYDVANTTFAISAADAEHPVPVRGAALAFEVSDWMRRLPAFTSVARPCGERLPRQRFVGLPSF